MQRFVLALTILGSLSCLSGAQEAEKSPAPVNFEEHVFPIFRQHCLQCHNANDAEAGLALDSFGALMEGSGSGDVVAEGDSGSSRLYLVMTHDEEPAMPPDQDPIPAEQLDIIKRWIDGGLLENSGSKAKKRKGPSLSFSMSDSGKPDEIIMPDQVWRVPVVTSQRSAAATAIAASPWAPLVAVAGQKQVALYHTESNDLLGVIPYPEGIPQVLRFNRDGGYLLVAGGTHASMGTASLYDVRNGQRLLSVGDELDVVFGADINDSMTRIALGGPQKMVRIFDTDSGDAVFELKKHTDWVYCVDYSPDGVLVASGDRSGGLHVWEAETGRLYLDLIGHKGAVRSLVWRADSNVLLSASEDGTVKMWEMNAGNQLKSFNAHSGGVTGIAMGQDGKIVTSGKDRTVKVWNADGSAVATMPAFSEPALEVAISHDSSRVIGGDWNGRTLMWQISDPKINTELLANPPSLTQQVAAQDNQVQQLASSREDILKRQKAGQQIIAAYLKTEEALGSKITDAKTAVSDASSKKVEAENKMKALQVQTKDLNTTTSGLKNKIAEMEKQLTSLKQMELSLADKVKQAIVRRDAAEVDAAKAKQLLASKLNQQEELKVKVATTSTNLLKQEMQLLAKIQLSADELAVAQQAHKALVEKSDAATKAIEQSKKVLESHAKKIADLVIKHTELGKALIQNNNMLTNANAAKTETESEMISIREKIQAETTEEEKVALTAQLKALETDLAEIINKVAQSNEAIGRIQVETKSVSTDLAKSKAAKGEEDKTLQKTVAENSAIGEQISSALAVLESAKNSHTGLTQEMDAFKQQMSKSDAEKLKAVSTIAKLIAEQQPIEQRLAASSSTVTSENGKIDGFQQEIKQLATQRNDAEALKQKTVQEFDTKSASLVSMKEELQGLPGTIQTYAKSMTDQQAAISSLQTTLAESITKREASQKTLQSVDQELVSVDSELNSANQKLRALQEELVAFESTSKRLRDEAEKAALIAQQKRAELDPLQKGVDGLATSISDRAKQMETAAAEMTRIQQELAMLEKAQQEAKAAQEQAQKKLDETSAAFEEIEAAEQTAKEKLEFFESAYGA